MLKNMQSLKQFWLTFRRRWVDDVTPVVSGTYQGQWLRGVRHGYGIRQSVSYDLAVRFPVQSAFATAAAGVVNALAAPGFIEKEDDTLLRERDLRIEESRGGFVLMARTTPLDRDSMSASSGSHRRMVLDKHGKPSLRKTIVSVHPGISFFSIRRSVTTK